MTILLGHHLEAHHVPVLVGLFAAGFFVGWQALAHWLRRGRPVDRTLEQESSPSDPLV